MTSAGLQNKRQISPEQGSPVFSKAVYQVYQLTVQIDNFIYAMPLVSKLRCMDGHCTIFFS